MVGVLLGAVILSLFGLGFFFYQSQSRRARIVELETRLQLNSEAHEREKKTIEDARNQLTQTFQALSSEALRANNQSFLELANTQLSKWQESAKGDLSKRQELIQELVKPMKEALLRVDTKIQEIEKSRARSDEAVVQHVRQLQEAQRDLRQETQHLVAALRAPQTRGQWGEIQLKRVVEMAGMLEHCDFLQQQSLATEDGRVRPDLIVKLPGGKNIVVDAKTPLAAFLDAFQTQDVGIRLQKLKEHAVHLRKHIEQLSRKSYWAQFQPSPEFVVLFVPGESFFSAALEQDPSLIELGVAQNVIVATPTTLIAMLRSIAYGWRQERLAANAREIALLGQELYKRTSDLSTHFVRLGKSLEHSVDSYNRAIGSLESRVLSTARKFKELDSSVQGVEVETPQQVDRVPRQIQSPELFLESKET